MAGDAGKSGEFGSIPDDLFGQLIQLYTTFAFSIAQDQIDGLALMAQAEHNAATATKVPHPVTLTQVCIALDTQAENLRTAKNPVDAAAAIKGLKDALTKLGGLWK